MYNYAQNIKNQVPRKDGGVQDQKEWEKVRDKERKIASSHPHPTFFWKEVQDRWYIPRVVGSGGVGVMIGASGTDGSLRCLDLLSGVRCNFELGVGLSGAVVRLPRSSRSVALVGGSPVFFFFFFFST
jgi:hypothetical protein